MKKVIYIVFTIFCLTACDPQDTVRAKSIRCFTNHDGNIFCYIHPPSPPPSPQDPTPEPECVQKCDPTGMWCTCG